MEVCDDPEPEDAAPSPKQKLTQTLGAEARELLTGGSHILPTQLPDGIYSPG